MFGRTRSLLIHDPGAEPGKAGSTRNTRAVRRRRAVWWKARCRRSARSHPPRQGSGGVVTLNVSWSVMRGPKRRGLLFEKLRGEQVSQFEV